MLAIYKALKTVPYITSGEESRYVILLALVDETKTADLLAKLQTTRSFVQNFKRFEYKAEQGVEAGQDHSTPGVVRPMSVRCIKISFAIKDATEMFEYIFAKLYQHGYGLDFEQQYELRHHVLLSTEDVYLQRALQLLNKIFAKADNPLCAEYSALLQMVYEVPIIFRISFVYKVCMLFKSRDYFTCASSFVALFSSQPICQTMLSQITARQNMTTAKDLESIICSPPFVYNSIWHFETDHNRETTSLTMAMPDATAQGNLLNAALKCSVGFTFEPKITNTGKPAVCFSFATANATKVFDCIMLLLQQNKVVVARKGIYNMRHILGFSRLQDYVASAQAVIEKITEDNLKAAEFNWLFAMLYEVPCTLRADYFTHIFTALLQKDLKQCALSLGFIFADDPFLSPAVTKQIADLRLQFYAAQILRIVSANQNPAPAPAAPAP